MAGRKQNQGDQKKEFSAGPIVYVQSKDGPKFLVMYHRGSYWNFPKGKLEKGERNIEAAMRETVEETGLREKDLKLKRGFRAHEKFQFKGNQGGRINKTVTLYLAESNNKNVKISEEHDGYGWFLYKDANRLLSKHKESQEVLRRANEFIQKKPLPSPQKKAAGRHRRSQRRS